MVEIVKEKIRASGASNAEALCCDITECHEVLNADYILVSQTLPHLSGKCSRTKKNREQAPTVKRKNRAENVEYESI
jgi:hypothetical protein